MIDDDTTYTYQDLFERVRAFASVLDQNTGLKQDTLVGVIADASFDTIAALLAVQSLGAGYLPMAPGIPDNQLFKVIVDANLKYLIVADDLVEHIEGILQQLNGVVVIPQSRLHDEAQVVEDITVDLDALPKDAQRTAYCIYTSGSTGNPKGIVIDAKGLSNLVTANRALFEIASGSRFLQFASLNFDASVYEIFSTLCNGGTLVMVDKNKVLPGEPLAAFVKRHNVGIICLPPSVIKTMMPYDLSGLDIAISAGESCPPQLADALIAKGVQFFNAYGPTETTVCASIHRAQGGEEPVPIGRPMPNTRIYLLDEAHQPVGKGEVGEMVVAGDCLLKGYANPETTDTSAILHHVCGEKRLYKTGDYAYKDLKTGELVFSGRKDNLVKIRGFRVELGAIEQVLESIPEVNNAVVKVAEQEIAHVQKRIRFLVAYVEMKAGAAFDDNALKAAVALNLPDYMVPQHYVHIDKMPMMANLSKIDRKALPPFEIELAQTDSGDQLAWAIAGFFDQALGFSEQVANPASDFFLLGGDSLMVAAVLSDINTAHSVLLPSETFYENPTPLKLAELVRKAKSGEKLHEKVDFFQEADIQFDLPADAYKASPSTMRSLLITGATGFTGTHILSELLERNQSLRVSALVRADSDKAAASRLVEAFEQRQLSTQHLDRVTAYRADIHAPYLGLSPTTYMELAGQIDAIMHVAADISYIRPYSGIKQVNVMGTKRMIDFAVEGQAKVLHYISSLSVFGAIGKFRDEGVVNEDYNIDLSEPFIQYENGYTISKWVAEKMVLNAFAQGVKGAVYRPGFIQGHRKTGVMNTGDLFCRLLVGCIQMGAFPDYPDKYWLPVPVDYVASSIAHIASSTDGLRYPAYHINTRFDLEATSTQIFELIRSLGYPLEKLDPEEWYKRLAKVDDSNELFPLVSFLTSPVYENERVLDIHRVTPKADCTRTHAMIQASNIAHPVVDRALIQHYLKHLAALELIPQMRKAGESCY